MSACPALKEPCELAPSAEESREFEVWGRFLLEEEPRWNAEFGSMDRWLDLNA
jgi:hypothetical protein